MVRTFEYVFVLICFHEIMSVADFTVVTSNVYHYVPPNGSAFPLHYVRGRRVALQVTDMNTYSLASQNLLI
jgi:hypothetical protein